MNKLICIGSLMIAFAGLLLPKAYAGHSYACAPLAKGAEELASWRDEGFPTPDPDAVVLDLIACLPERDPFLRDRIGYEGISTILRRGVVSVSAREQMLARLLPMLESEDDAGVAAPFAALALSEIMRTDRLDPFLHGATRSAVVSQAGTYLMGVGDYRGLVDGEGWRHGVAHGADLVLQLVLNPAVSDEQVKSLSRSVFSQVDAGGGRSYIFGEPGRLARPVLYAALREGVEAEHWQQLFSELADPSPLLAWSAAFDSEMGMARLHNTRSFAQAVYIAGLGSGRAELDALTEVAKALLDALP